MKTPARTLVLVAATLSAVLAAVPAAALEPIGSTSGFASRIDRGGLSQRQAERRAERLAERARKQEQSLRQEAESTMVEASQPSRTAPVVARQSEAPLSRD